MIVMTTDVNIEGISNKIEIHCTQPCKECHRDIARLTEEKCANRIWIPARHTMVAKGDKVKAMKRFLEELG